MKTGWSTTLIIQELCSNPDIEVGLSDSDNEGDDGYQMVKDETFSDTSSSDQMTVDGHSPPLLPTWNSRLVMCVCVCVCV